MTLPRNKFEIGVKYVRIVRLLEHLQQNNAEMPRTIKIYFCSYVSRVSRNLEATFSLKLCGSSTSTADP